MRLKACIQAGLTDVPVKQAKELTEEVVVADSTAVEAIQRQAPRRGLRVNLWQRRPR